MLRVQVNGYQLLQALRAKGGRVVTVLLTRANMLMFMLQSKIVSEKLSGQVLHRRTGVLSASVQPIPATLDMDNLKIKFGIQAGGSAAFYAAVHEYGGSRAYEVTSVKARALQFVTNGKTVYAHSIMQPPAKQRAFMGPSAEEFLPTIQSELNRAVHDALTE